MLPNPPMECGGRGVTSCQWRTCKNVRFSINAAVSWPPQTCRDTVSSESSGDSPVRVPSGCSPLKQVGTHVCSRNHQHIRARHRQFQVLQPSPDLGLINQSPGLCTLSASVFFHTYSAACESSSSMIAPVLKKAQPPCQSQIVGGQYSCTVRSTPLAPSPCHCPRQSRLGLEDRAGDLARR